MDIRQIISNAKSLEKQLVDLKRQHDAHKLKIYEFFDNKQLKTYTVKPSESLGIAKTIVANKIERVYIKYFAEKLKEKLDKEVCNEIIDKTYIVKDMDGLVKLLKEAGVSPKEFKQFIDVSEVVNTAKLKQLYSVGEITRDNLKGCFEVEIKKSLQIKEIEG